MFQVCEAVNTISDVAKGNQPQGGQSSFEGPGALAAALDDFDSSILMNPLTYNEAKTRKTLNTGGVGSNPTSVTRFGCYEDK